MSIATARGLLAALALGAAGAPAGAWADATRHAEPSQYVTYAEVVEVTPRYGWHEVSEPVRRCEDVTVRAQPRHHSRYRDDHRYVDHRYRRREQGGAAAGLVGGLIGGLIGNQFGDGNGRTALTVVGAALGASVARDHVHRSRDRYDDYGHMERYCSETMRTRSVRGVRGYDVAYRYQGRIFHKWMNEHPGNSVPVQVAVEPVGGLVAR